MLSIIKPNLNIFEPPGCRAKRAGPARLNQFRTVLGPALRPMGRHGPIIFSCLSRSCLNGPCLDGPVPGRAGPPVWPPIVWRLFMTTLWWGPCQRVLRSDILLHRVRSNPSRGSMKNSAQKYCAKLHWSSKSQYQYQKFGVNFKLISQMLYFHTHLHIYIIKQDHYHLYLFITWYD